MTAAEGARCAHRQWAASVAQTDVRGSAGCVTPSTRWSQVAVPIRHPHLRRADPDLHPALLAADRAGGCGLGRTAARRALHRGVGDLRHRPRDRRHGDVLVAVRQRARVHRREHRRHRRADARVDPWPRDLAAARAAREAASRRATPIPRASTSGRWPNDRPSASGRSAACSRRSRSAPSSSSSSIAIAMVPSMLAAGYDAFHSIWYSFYYSAMAFTNTGFSPNPGGMEPFVHDYWFQTHADDRRLPRQPRLPGDLRARPIVAHPAPLERAREAHAHHDGHPLRARRRRLPSARVQQPEDLRAAGCRLRPSSSRSSCRP